MKILSILTAIIVAAVLYLLVMEREALLGWTGAPETAQADSPADAAPQGTTDSRVSEQPSISVMARRSLSQEIDSAVQLRGETQAMRQVDVVPETRGKVVNDPLRRGALVEAGDLLCEIAPGTRGVSLQEAQARLSEARARLPEARARLLEAQAQEPAARAAILEAEANVPAAEASLAQARASVPAAEAGLLEAQARLPEAEARLTEARAMVPAAEAALRQAQANVPAAEAALAQAEAGRPEAQARLREAEARVREADISLNANSRLNRSGFAGEIALASAQAAFESAKAGEQSALAGVKAADAAVEQAKGALEGARAQVASAESQVESARAAVRAAESQIQNARAGIETARSNIESARAAVQSALSQVEGARAAVSASTAALEGAVAGIETAKAGEENALSGIQSAEAALATTRQDIERLSLYAPFGGVLESDTAELGALLNPEAGSVCATIIQIDPIKIAGFVPESSVGRIEQGAQATARLIDGREVTGQVSFVSRSADPVTRTFLVELTVPNADLSIRDGQTVDIVIAAEGAQAHLLPQSALTLNDNGDLGVRLVDDAGRAQFAAVSVLRDTRDGVWVSGLPDSADVIILGQEYVTDGVPVAAQFEEVIQ
ncbi:efflux RND transporter periplasmic adaptor subunit [Sagittula sp. SSi028]|uniref:efflux RND transporter periplasmic adaptor subunit n=1 Tax=Sagittula sp. SSi028 TaxID=3400636 RepID=UPI003AF6D80F